MTGPCPTQLQAARWTAGTSGAAFALDGPRDHWRAIALGVQHDFVPLPTDLGRRTPPARLHRQRAGNRQTGHVTDPAGGLPDLRRRRLRMVSKQNLRDDPLRLLRAARLSPPHSVSAWKRRPASACNSWHARRYPRAGRRRPPSALATELNALLLLAERAARGVLLLQELNLLALYLPELSEGRASCRAAFTTWTCCTTTSKRCISCWPAFPTPTWH